MAQRIYTISFGLYHFTIKIIPKSAPNNTPGKSNKSNHRCQAVQLQLAGVMRGKRAAWCALACLLLALSSEALPFGQSNQYNAWPSIPAEWVSGTEILRSHYDGETHHFMVPMRDGVHLSTTVLLPHRSNMTA